MYGLRDTEREREWGNPHHTRRKIEIWNSILTLQLPYPQLCWWLWAVCVCVGSIYVVYLVSVNTIDLILVINWIGEWKWGMLFTWRPSLLCYIDACWMRFVGDNVDINDANRWVLCRPQKQINHIPDEHSHTFIPKPFHTLPTYPPVSASHQNIYRWWANILPLPSDREEELPQNPNSAHFASRILAFWHIANWQKSSINLQSGWWFSDFGQKK